jgi:two-component system chemotaxis response regulator CheY
MMPEMDGQAALKEIRLLEQTRGLAGPDRAKIIMTTALADAANVLMAREQLCDHFLVKPIQKLKLVEVLRGLALIDSGATRRNARHETGPTSSGTDTPNS